ncbi:response regulator [Neorhodopirellula lusitana]|uniref:response regulator n=1 Tax=Neorhodopirellula lusitana TaxID=445327 RepID=UPI00384B78B3
MPTTSNIVVLIAEDDPVFRQLLKFTIERAGHKVHCAGDGNEAWLQLQETDFDLLVTDQQMPNCTGIELLEKMRASREAQPSQAKVTATILCTANGLELDGVRLKEKFGLLAVLAKPFSPKQLVHVIDSHFRGQSKAIAPVVDTPRGVWQVGQVS